MAWLSPPTPQRVIDLLLIHWPDHITLYGEPIEALEKLKKDGKIRHYGVSNFSPAMMDVCESTGHSAANQLGYHLFDRRVERAVLPYAQAHGIGFMAYGTLGFASCPERSPSRPPSWTGTGGRGATPSACLCSSASSSSSNCGWSNGSRQTPSAMASRWPNSRSRGYWATPRSPWGWSASAAPRN